MPKEMISANWRASKRTITGLVNAGYTNEQRKRILIKFYKRYGGTDVESPSTLYNKWVRVENAHGIKPDNSAGKKLDETRDKDIANKPEDAHEKAEAAKDMGENLENKAIQDLIKARWPHTDWSDAFSKMD